MCFTWDTHGKSCPIVEKNAAIFSGKAVGFLSPESQIQVIPPSKTRSAESLKSVLDLFIFLDNLVRG